MTATPSTGPARRALGASISETETVVQRVTIFTSAPDGTGGFNLQHSSVEWVGAASLSGSAAVSTPQCRSVPLQCRLMPLCHLVTRAPSTPVYYMPRAAWAVAMRFVRRRGVRYLGERVPSQVMHSIEK
jgi:hypothetical protein